MKTFGIILILFANLVLYSGAVYSWYLICAKKEPLSFFTEDFKKKGVAIFFTIGALIVSFLLIIFFLHFFEKKEFVRTMNNLILPLFIELICIFIAGIGWYSVLKKEKLLFEDQVLSDMTMTIFTVLAILLPFIFF